MRVVYPEIMARYEVRRFVEWDCRKFFSADTAVCSEDQLPTLATCSRKYQEIIPADLCPSGITEVWRSSSCRPTSALSLSWLLPLPVSSPALALLRPGVNGASCSTGESSCLLLSRGTAFLAYCSCCCFLDVAGRATRPARGSRFMGSLAPSSLAFSFWSWLRL